MNLITCKTAGMLSCIFGTSTEPKYKSEMDRAVQYVVYRFTSNEKIDLDDPLNIVSIVCDNFYRLPYKDGETEYRYVVTALDRLHNESAPMMSLVKL